MPATYAHCRFGKEMLHLMPADVRGTAKRYRQLFDVGLQGPDLFFYYRPDITGKVRRLGQKFHMQTGREFFSRACRNLRREPDDSGQAYLYGVLCHYVLDAGCHSLVTQGENLLRIEATFDHFLMARDGFSASDPWLITALSDQQWSALSRFYPGTDKRIFHHSLRCMGKASMGKQVPDPEYARWNQPLLERYRQAAEIFPQMLLKLIAHLQYNAPLGENFDPIFG